MDTSSNKSISVKSMVYVSVLMVALMMGVDCQADSSTDANTLGFLPADGPKVQWVFSGLIRSEQGQVLAYYFQIERVGHHFYSEARLFDAQTKQVIFEDSSEATNNKPMGYRWKIGYAFMQFNPINDSWVIAVKNQKKQGFNFKVDMLKPGMIDAKSALRYPGITAAIWQANALNGHVRVGKMDTFVTAKHTLFRQMSTMEAQVSADYAVNGMMCEFDNGKNVSSLSSPEIDGPHAALRLKQDVQGSWDIRALSSLHLILSRYTKQRTLMAGFVEGKPAAGFCVLSQANLNRHVS